jgi:uncharacterized protein YbaA (DUF1428 family)
MDLWYRYRRKTCRHIVAWHGRRGKSGVSTAPNTECVADDVKVGKTTSFPQSVKLKPDETVVFSWIVYESRAQRNRVMKKVMSDPRLASMMDPKSMPFDGKRMIYGGFKHLVDV